jgi:protein tyrosine phosphatase
MKRIIILSVLLAIQFYHTAIASEDHAPRTFPSLPSVYRENRIKQIQEAFEERSKRYLQGRQLHAYKAKKPDAEILAEFRQIKEWRNHSWFSESTHGALVSRPDFIVAQDLLEKGYYKRPHLLAFQYNQTDGSYNSSTIVLNGQRFLALEAPATEKLTQLFFNLLQNHQVTQLVRLTPAEEGGTIKSRNYWKNRTHKDPKTGAEYLDVPFAGSRKTNAIRYYAIDHWRDHQGFDAKQLLAFIQKVRKDYDPNSGLLACHCSGGVGRTGTFLAGFLLLQEIDRQLAAGLAKEALDISIEKVVLQLSLQRFYMVAKEDQYLTLYRLVDLYLQTKS